MVVVLVPWPCVRVHVYYTHTHVQYSTFFCAGTLKKRTIYMK